MALSNFILLIFSACIHVVAHIAIKKAKNREAFVWWLLFWVWVLFIPVLFFEFKQVNSEVWIYILFSSIFEAMYFFFIGKAYRESDLSIVYPLSRGTAPIFLLIWTILFMDENPKPGGILGIFLIACGLYVINLPKLGAWFEPIRSLSQKGPRFALFSGFCISVYTVIDREGIQFAPPLIFTYLSMWLTWILLTPYTLYSIGWNKIKAELLETKFTSIIAGFTTMTAYVIILFIMLSGELTSYVGAVREMSVILGTGIGVLFLKEAGGNLRILGAIIVSIGVFFIKFSG